MCQRGWIGKCTTSHFLKKSVHFLSSGTVPQKEKTNEFLPSTFQEAAHVLNSACFEQEHKRNSWDSETAVRCKCAGQ